MASNSGSKKKLTRRLSEDGKKTSWEDEQKQSIVVDPFYFNAGRVRSSSFSKEKIVKRNNSKDGKVDSKVVLKPQSESQHTGDPDGDITNVPKSKEDKNTNDEDNS